MTRRSSEADEHAPLDRVRTLGSRVLGRLRSLKLWARILIFAAVFHFLVLPQIGGTRRAFGLLSDLNPLYVIGAVACEIGALLCYAQLSRALLPEEGRPDLWRMFRVVLSSMSVSHVVPGGAAAGGVLQYRLLTTFGTAPSQATFAMATQSLGSAVVLNALLWIGLVVSIPAAASSRCTPPPRWSVWC